MRLPAQVEPTEAPEAVGGKPKMIECCYIVRVLLIGLTPFFSLASVSLLVSQSSAISFQDLIGHRK